MTKALPEFHVDQNSSSKLSVPAKVELYDLCQDSFSSLDWIIPSFLLALCPFLF